MFVIKSNLVIWFIAYDGEVKISYRFVFFFFIRFYILFLILLLNNNICYN